MDSPAAVYGSYVSDLERNFTILRRTATRRGGNSVWARVDRKPPWFAQAVSRHFLPWLWLCRQICAAI